MSTPSDDTPSWAEQEYERCMQRIRELPPPMTNEEVIHILVTMSVEQAAEIERLRERAEELDGVLRNIDLNLDTPNNLTTYQMDFLLKTIREIVKGVLRVAVTEKKAPPPTDSATAPRHPDSGS